jgi:hypothetical protein
MSKLERRPPRGRGAADRPGAAPLTLRRQLADGRRQARMKANNRPSAA